MVEQTEQVKEPEQVEQPEHNEKFALFIARISIGTMTETDHSVWLGDGCWTSQLEEAILFETASEAEKTLQTIDIGNEVANIVAINYYDTTNL